MLTCKTCKAWVTGYLSYDGECKTCDSREWQRVYSDLNHSVAWMLEAAMNPEHNRSRGAAGSVVTPA